jgi:acyl carrier protein
MNIEETIRSYIQNSQGDGSAPAGDGPGRDDDLLALLDSLQILRMLLDLESQYSIKVENSELSPENLGTIARLAEFIGRKRQEAACQGQPT